jgi:hypothetical protein
MSPQHLRRCKELTLDCWWPPKISTPAWANISAELKETASMEQKSNSALAAECYKLADLAESELPSWV